MIWLTSVLTLLWGACVYGCPLKCDCATKKVICSNAYITGPELNRLMNHLPKTSVHLDLSGNNLTDINMALFENFRALTSLNLAGNMLRVFPKNTDKYMPKLTVLYLNNNRLTSMEIDQIHGCRNLKRLDLSGNFLTQLKDHTFAECANLVDLNLSYNQIGFISNRAFVDLPKLWYLDISHNFLKDIRTGTLDGLHNLQKVWLNNNCLHRVQRGLFSKTNIVLAHIDISHNDILYLDEDIFDHQYVWRMDLSYNNILFLSPTFAHATEIGAELNLTQNPIRCDCQLEMLINLGLIIGVCNSPSIMAGTLINEALERGNLDCDICSYNPCKGKKLCTSHPNSSYTCTKPSRQSKCHSNEPVCPKQFCSKNALKCVHANFAYECKCRAGYYGKYCDLFYEDELHATDTNKHIYVVVGTAGACFFFLLATSLFCALRSCTRKKHSSEKSIADDVIMLKETKIVFQTYITSL